MQKTQPARVVQSAAPTPQRHVPAQQSTTTYQHGPEPWRSARYAASKLKMSRDTIKSLFDDNIIRTAPKGKRRVTTDSWIAEYQEQMFHINERKSKVQHERRLPPPMVIIEAGKGTPEGVPYTISSASTNHTTTIGGV